MRIYKPSDPALVKATSLYAPKNINKLAFSPINLFVCVCVCVCVCMCAGSVCMCVLVVCVHVHVCACTLVEG